MTFWSIPLLIRLKVTRFCLDLDVFFIHLRVDRGSGYEQDHSNNGTMEVPGTIGFHLRSPR